LQAERRGRVGVVGKKKKKKKREDVDCGGEDRGRLWGRWTIEVGFSILPYISEELKWVVGLHLN